MNLERQRGCVNADGGERSAPAGWLRRTHHGKENAMRHALQYRGRRPITQQDISAALAQFLGHGGMIQRLPAQNFQPAGTVGGEKYQAFETFSDLTRLAGNSEQAS
jgi:hypothetical protein